MAFSLGSCESSTLRGLVLPNSDTTRAVTGVTTAEELSSERAGQERAQPGAAANLTPAWTAGQFRRQPQNGETASILALCKRKLTTPRRASGIGIEALGRIRRVRAAVRVAPATASQSGLREPFASLPAPTTPRRADAKTLASSRG